MKAMVYVRFDSVARAIDLDKKGSLEKGLDEIDAELKQRKQTRR